MRKRRKQRALQPPKNNFPGNALNLRVNAPVAKGRIRRSPAPTQIFGKGGSLYVTHCEYIGEIPGSTNYAVTTFPLNPGWHTTFPWLSTIAQQYEKYEFERLSFETNTVAPTTLPGIIILGTDWDASDPATTGKDQIYSFPDSVSSPSWESVVYVAKPAELKALGKRFIRAGLNPGNTDIKLYDIGNFQVATQGQAVTTTIAELFVCYTIRLSEPQLSSIGFNSLSGQYGIVNATNLALTLATPQTTAPFTTATITGANYAFVLTALAPSEYLIGIDAAGTTFSAVSFTGSTATVLNSNGLTAAAGTSFTVWYVVKFLTGQTFQQNVTNATLTQFTVDVAPYGLSS